MAEYPEARFLTSANAVSQFVEDTGAEVAVGGRSNAGKSSAINAIVNRRQFARTSKTPGRTQLVNFFELSAGRRLVDLPGYGFARVADSVRRHWDSLLTAYFRGRNSLAGLILVVDIRRGVSEFDERMLEFADSIALPMHILLTKADKLKRAQVEQAVAEARKALNGRASVQAFSALKRQGEVEARLVLERLLDGRNARDES
jgi:GTP-binding protein